MSAPQSNVNLGHVNLPILVNTTAQHILSYRTVVFAGRIYNLQAESQVAAHNQRRCEAECQICI